VSPKVVSSSDMDVEVAASSFVPPSTVRPNDGAIHVQVSSQVASAPVTTTPDTGVEVAARSVCSNNDGKPFGTSAVPSAVPLSSSEVRLRVVHKAVEGVVRSFQSLSLPTVSVNMDRLDACNEDHQRRLLKEVINRPRGPVVTGLVFGVWSAVNLEQAGANLCQALRVGKRWDVFAALHEAWNGAAYKQLAAFYDQTATKPTGTFADYVRRLGQACTDPATGQASPINITDAKLKKFRNSEYWWELLQLCPFAMFLVDQCDTPYREIAMVIGRKGGPQQLAQYFEECVATVRAERMALQTQTHSQ
jgi:hypothetical protein